MHRCRRLLTADCKESINAVLMMRMRAIAGADARGQRLYDELFPQPGRFNDQLPAALSLEELAAFDRVLVRLGETAERIAVARPLADKADRRRGGARRLREPAEPPPNGPAAELRPVRRTWSPVVTERRLKPGAWERNGRAMSASIPPTPPLSSDAIFPERTNVPAGPPQAVRLTLEPATVTRVLLACYGVLLVMNLLVIWSKLGGWHFPARHLFYFDDEANIPNVFSTLLLVSASALLACTGAAMLQRRARFAYHWLALSLIFLGLGVDEAASVHELLTHPMRRMFGSAGGGLYFSWVVAGGAGVLVIGLAYLPFLWALPRATRIRFIVSGIVYVGGALAMEVIGGRTFIEQGDAELTLAYAISVTVEESMEMLGVVLFIRAILMHMRTFATGVLLRFDGKGAEAPAARSTR